MSQMQMNSTTVWLQRLLMLSGCILMLALIPVFFPISLMATLHEKLGLGTFPDTPIVAYLTRSTSMLYFVHGVVTFWAAMNIRECSKLIPVLGILHVVMGLILLGIDLAAPMPLYWIALEGVPIASLGLLIVWMWNRGIRKTQTGDSRNN